MAAKSWIPVSDDCPFSLANIPFGVISSPDAPTPRIAIAIGEFAIDMQALANYNGFADLPDAYPHIGVFMQPNLNAFAALGRPFHRSIREYMQKILTAGGPYAQTLEKSPRMRTMILRPLKLISKHVPMQIGDYTDFYAGRHHAFNIGAMFRGAAAALQPNYEHLPVGYHGRASSIVVSGTPVKRPAGQVLPPGDAAAPVLARSAKLDMELELAAFVCKDSAMGESIPVGAAGEHIFGYVLMNDWSARDVQAWEYVPLGPFLSKSFATTVSPWVVLADALEPFRAAGLAPGDRKSLLPYLREERGRAENALDMTLSVELKTKGGASTEITRGNAKNLLYSFEQMLAHHSVGGCPMRVGDLIGSGTISGESKSEMGCLLEMTKNGTEPVKLEDGEERSFLEDGDEVIMRGFCGEKGSLVGFGDCSGVIV